MTEQQHVEYHERRFMTAGALILLDLLLLPWLAYAYHEVAEFQTYAQVLLAPALPIAGVAIAEWISSGRPYKSCPCRWRPR